MALESLVCRPLYRDRDIRFHPVYPYAQPRPMVFCRHPGGVGTFPHALDLRSTAGNTGSCRSKTDGPAAGCRLQASELPCWHPGGWQCSRSPCAGRRWLSGFRWPGHWSGLHSFILPVGLNTPHLSHRQGDSHDRIKRRRRFLHPSGIPTGCWAVFRDLTNTSLCDLRLNIYPSSQRFPESHDLALPT